MKLKLTLLFGFISFLSLGQEEDIKLPSITPPSPDAQAVTKYGDLPMNEFNGMVNYTLPLYTYRAAHLELPISINYTGAGVKVDDLPTWVGINWTLNAGGVITRTVKDIPDETAVQRIQLTDTEVNYYSTNNNDGTSKAQFLRELIENSQIDSEADMFNFSFGEYSGSFYLDENLLAIPFKANSPFKIITGSDFINNHLIKIITPDGVTYTFGGEGAIEETSTRYIVNNSQQPDNYGGITAFYLKSVEHPLNGTIYFNYTNNLGIKIVPIQKIQKRKKTIIANVEPCTPPAYDTTEYTSVSTRVLNPKYLTKIYSPNSNQEILFISHTIDNMYFNMVLDKIIVQDSNPTITDPIKTIDFNYTGFSSSGAPFGGYSDNTKRFFLEKVTFDKDNPYSTNTQFGRRNEVYKFEYNSEMGLPPRFAFSQDYAGYFNGKDNLSSLPNNIVFNPNNTIGFADRRPDFNYASLGSLTRIYYPTGGYTEFEYEAKKVKEKQFSTVLLHAYRNQMNLVSPNHLSDGIPRATLDGIEYNQPIIEDQNATIFISMEIPPNYEANHFTDKLHLIVQEVAPNDNVTPISDTLIAMSDSPPQTDPGYLDSHIYNTTQGVTLYQGMRYRISIVIDALEKPLDVKATFSFTDGYVEADDVGVLLKKQTDFAAEGQPQNIKRYYYAAIENIHPSINDLPLRDSNFTIQQPEIVNYICNPCDPSATTGPVECYYKFLYLLSDKIDFSGIKGIGNFEKVTISYGGDDFEKGGVEKTFQTDTPFGSVIIPTSQSISPPCPQSNYEHLVDHLLVSVPSPINGNLLIERYFAKKEGSIKKISEKTFAYDTSQVSHINNPYGSKLYKALWFCDGVNINNTASNYFVAQYRLGSIKNELITKHSIDYIDPVPLYVTDESSYKKMETTESYEYGSLKGLPTKIITTTSDGSINETRNYYVNQEAELNQQHPMNNDQIHALATLLDKNIVNSPVQVTKYNNTDLIYTQRTLYKDYGSNSILKILPEIIQSGKGNISELEDRVVFSEYDPRGNPSIVSYADGTKTKYFYNGYNQVYMKIENYIVSSGGSGGEFTDTDIIQNPEPCNLFSMFPKSFVTLYFYNSITHQMTGMLDSNCRKTIYEYDALNRLKYIKSQEEEGGAITILKEFDSNYKRY